MSYKLKPGLNSCTNEQYHGDKTYMSSSNLKTLLKSAEDFYDEFFLKKRAPTPKSRQNAYDEGSYAHALILEPEVIDDEFAFYPEFRKFGAQWDAFKASNEGKIILSKPQKHRVERWYESYKKLDVAKKLISGGKAEESLAGTLAGVPIKVRADYINEDAGYIADVKTTAYDPTVESFKYVVENLKYDLSAALYRNMFREYYKKDFDFYFIVLGKKDAICHVYKASEETLQRGDMMINEALMKYKKCKETGVWKDTEKFTIESKDYEILEV